MTTGLCVAMVPSRLILAPPPGLEPGTQGLGIHIRQYRQKLTQDLKSKKIVLTTACYKY
jgi:hypothetical protein